MQHAPKITMSGPAPIAEAAQVHVDANARYLESIEATGKAVAHAAEVKRKHDAAVQAASAIGAALPATTAIVKADEAVVAAKRRQQECRDIAVGKGRSLTRVVAAHASEWREQLVEQREAADDALEAARLGYVDAIEAAADVRGVDEWITRCQQAAATTTMPPNLPPSVPPEVVLGVHDPRLLIGKFHSWMARGGAEAPHTRPMRVDDAA